MEKVGLDVAIVSDPKNVTYLTGYVDDGTVPVPTYLVLLSNGADILLTGARKVDAISEFFADEIITFQNYHLGSRMVARPDLASALLVPLVGRDGKVRRVGVESWHTPKAVLDSVQKAAPGVSFINISESIESMRMVKDADEVAAIRASCRLVDYAYSVAESLSVPGISEVELYAAVHQKVIEKAGGFQDFAGDFVTGERSIKPGGGPPTSLMLKRGDTLILDLWTTTRGYWADTCRTFLVGGAPAREQRDVYRVVEKAMEAGVSKMKPGTTGSDVYRVMKQVMKEAGYGNLFPHHGGHGIGLDPWERPFLIPGSKDTIEEGMVLALEPGVYLKGVAGVRLENNYLVGKDGAMSLSKYPIGW